ncbi:Arc family DNA-binding protein [Acinetobacter sp. HY1485]|uniref:Arc family DNA-binding protein n=1 Tax=Acinetobacter sp. HY1485 TaxID=2970918 RepID=UPI0022B9B540|nr:Arc family DNA-binding protein [Acinetobacter sp. HY1485]
MSREDSQLKIRLSPELKSFIEEQAKKNHRTLNGEITARLEETRTTEDEVKVRIINLPDNYKSKRLVYGKLANTFKIDYSQDLSEIKKDLELALTALERSSLKHRLACINKNVRVYEGGSHLDIIDDGKGSLNWLIIEDHWVDKKAP